MYVTYLSLNFGAVFPRSLGYLGPEKRFHIKSKGKSWWFDLFFLKGKIYTTELKYLLKILFSILSTFIINKMGNEKEHLH
jgi:hypothetical protein